MEKRILRGSLPCQLVNIVQNQHIYQLIEVQEIVNLVLAHGFRELRLEDIGRHVQHHLIRVVLLYFHTDCLCQMRFAQTGTSVYQQRIESRSPGILGNSYRGRFCQPVAATFYITIQCIGRVQLRVNLYTIIITLKRIFRGIISCFTVQINGTWLNLLHVRGRHRH